MLTKNTIDLVKERVSIVDVVSDYVKLQKKGRNLMGCCPFHNERTPSFAVSVTNNIFKCFGCGIAGDAISFIEKIENVDFIEAVKIIAKKYDIEIVETNTSTANSKRQNAYSLLSNAQTFFCQQLINNDEAMAYIAKRQISQDSINKFKIGYDIGSTWWNHCNTNKELQLELGLIMNNGTTICDRFQDRIIFPITNKHGDIVGFAGRLLKTDNTTKAKYINSPESFIYQKSHTLFGLYQSKKTIQQQNKCYLVEGYVDVIMMHQMGITNTVASSGTSLTDEQCRLLKTISSTVTILYDGDEPGIKSTNRAIERLLAHGLMVNVITLPDGNDPDSFARLHPNDLHSTIESLETDFLTHKINIINTFDDINTKSVEIRHLISLVNSIPDTIYHDMLLARIKETLHIDTDLIVINKTQHQIQKYTPANATIEDFEREIMKLLILYGEQLIDENKTIADYIIQETDDIEFKYNNHIKIIDFYKNNDTKIITTKKLLQQIDDEELKTYVINTISDRRTISDKWITQTDININDKLNVLGKNIRTAIMNLKKMIIKQMYNDRKELLNSNECDINKILDELNLLKQYEIAINKEIQG